MFPQTVIVGDRAGSVFYVRAGKSPRRPAGFDWSKPVDGSTVGERVAGIPRAGGSHPDRSTRRPGFVLDTNNAPDVAVAAAADRLGDRTPTICSTTSPAAPPGAAFAPARCSRATPTSPGTTRSRWRSTRPGPRRRAGRQRSSTRAATFPERDGRGCRARRSSSRGCSASTVARSADSTDALAFHYFREGFSPPSSGRGSPSATARRWRDGELDATARAGRARSRQAAREAWIAAGGEQATLGDLFRIGRGGEHGIGGVTIDEPAIPDCRARLSPFCDVTQRALLAGAARRERAAPRHARLAVAAAGAVHRSDPFVHAPSLRAEPGPAVTALRRSIEARRRGALEADLVRARRAAAAPRIGARARGERRRRVERRRAMKRVVVIGAGVAGLCCARELQRRGVHPIVIDSGPPGGGCSAGNAGWITPSLSGPLPAPGTSWSALLGLLHRDSPLYIRPRAVPSLVSWLWRFHRSCNQRDYLAGLRATAKLALRSPRALRRAALRRRRARAARHRAPLPVPRSALRRRDARATSSTIAISATASRYYCAAKRCAPRSRASTPAWSRACWCARSGTCVPRACAPASPRCSPATAPSCSPAARWCRSRRATGGSRRRSTTPATPSKATRSCWRRARARVGSRRASACGFRCRPPRDTA